LGELLLVIGKNLKEEIHISRDITTSSFLIDN